MSARKLEVEWEHLDEKAEWNITYRTRLNELCPEGEETGEQRAIASDEADEWLKRLRGEL